MWGSDSAGTQLSGGRPGLPWQEVRVLSFQGRRQAWPCAGWRWAGGAPGLLSGSPQQGCLCRSPSASIRRGGCSPAQVAVHSSVLPSQGCWCNAPALLRTGLPLRGSGAPSHSLPAHLPQWPYSAPPLQCAQSPGLSRALWKRVTAHLAACWFPLRVEGGGSRVDATEVRSWQEGELGGPPASSALGRGRLTPAQRGGQTLC